MCRCTNYLDGGRVILFVIETFHFFEFADPKEENVSRHLWCLCKSDFPFLSFHFLFSLLVVMAVVLLLPSSSSSQRRSLLETETMFEEDILEITFNLSSSTMTSKHISALKFGLSTQGKRCLAPIGSKSVARTYPEP